MIKDSGTRKEFKTGAVRDIQEGKGREDLLPLKQVRDLTRSSVIDALAEFKLKHNPSCIHRAIQMFCIEQDWDVWTALLEVGIHFEEGCKKYGQDNWKKGLPMSCYLSSGLRHYFKVRRGDDDENHARAFIWNMLCMAWTLENIPEMDDINKEWNCMQCEYCEKHPKTHRDICTNDHSPLYKEAVSMLDVCDIFKEF